MPRLRQRRDWDWEPTKDDFPEALSPPTGDESDDEVNSTSRPYEGVEGEGSTGNSWLANDVIIGSLPDNKLKAALARYQAIVRICEAELRSRALLPRRSAKRRQPSDAAPSVLDCGRRLRQPKKQQPGLTLTPEQMLNALQALQSLSKLQTKDKQQCQTSVQSGQSNEGLASS